MSIRRDPLSWEQGFTRMPNGWVRDERLSWKARGLLAYLMSHAEGWSTSVRDLEQHGPDGKAAVRTGILELEAAGYLRRSEQAFGDGHLFGEVDYIITDPAENPLSDYRSSDYRSSENRQTYKKNSSTEEQPSEHQQQRRGRATQKQIDMLADLWKASGMWPTDEIQAEWREWSMADADTKIRELKRQRRMMA